MVFPPVPVYLEHPTWLQQQNLQQAGDSTVENPQLPIAIVPPPPPSGVGGTITIKTCSMSERTRLVKLPHLETPLKCPRCESTNTKFCYFNNYSLSQPRHFCKTCRRYWTRGGALRNVPVGGGCRRSSKRSKGSRLKSPATARTSSTSTSGFSSTTSSMPLLENSMLETNKFITNSPLNSQLPFLPSLLNVPEFPNAEIGLNSCGSELGFKFGNASVALGDQCMSSNQAVQWMSSNQAHQFSCFTGRFGQPAGGYHFEGEGINQVPYLGGAADDQVGTRSEMEVGLEQLSSANLEENQGLCLSKNVSGFPGNDQYWNGNTWRDLSGSAFFC